VILYSKEFGVVSRDGELAEELNSWAEVSKVYAVERAERSRVALYFGSVSSALRSTSVLWTVVRRLERKYSVAGKMVSKSVKYCPSPYAYGTRIPNVDIQW